MTMIDSITVRVRNNKAGGISPEDMDRAIRAIKEGFTSKHPQLSISIETGVATTDITGILTDES